MTTQTILSFSSTEATLAHAGGKAANLVKLVRAGFPVPGGFIIATPAYRAFVEANALDEKIASALVDLHADDPSALDATSNTIQAAFRDGTMPAQLVRDIATAYAALSAPPVAVRSSATAEDLPDLSFAGQQDTYLNIIGEEALLCAVVNCWSSLWTARAVGYRARNHISHIDAALAVIVQAMVQSEASGVMFTANPLTGLRTEIVIDATLGLGEALVSGQVEPDNYIVDTTRGLIRSKSLGAKAIVIRSAAGGGIVTQDQNAANQQALPDAQILELAELGRRVAEKYEGVPQDIEWAWARGNLFLLQSRAITSLFPLPAGMKPEPLRLLFSFGAVQGVLDPITPLGQDMIRLVFSGGATLFGFRLNDQAQTVLRQAGERLWIDLTPVARHPLGYRALPGIFGVVEAGSQPSLQELLNDPRLQPGKQGLKFLTLWRIARFALPAVANIIRNWLEPDHRPEQIRQLMERDVAELQAESAAITGTREKRLARRIQLFADLKRVFPDHVLPVAYDLATGMGPLSLLLRISQAATGSEILGLQITRGLANNVTTEMDLILWQTAEEIRVDTTSFEFVQNRSAEDLAHVYLAGALPTVAQNAVARFLERYGMRGLGEIDIGRARWREDPTPVFQSLASYLQIDHPEMAPDAVFAKGVREAKTAARELEAAVRKMPRGWFKARVVRWAVRRTRTFVGLRESPKFYLIRRLGIVRQALLESGKEWVDAGVLSQPDDLFFLTFEELQALARGEEREWKQTVSAHRTAYAREQMRHQIPRLLISDGRAFYGGTRDASVADGSLRGSPVSPGVAEGRVHIVLDPHTAQLAPGEILVCRGTDPAWTPLFLSAGGLVMEVGGMMTHGAVVAREYGLPAVVGVHNATTRLKTGDRVRVDGNRGTVSIIE